MDCLDSGRVCSLTLAIFALMHRHWVYAKVCPESVGSGVALVELLAAWDIRDFGIGNWHND